MHFDTFINCLLAYLTSLLTYSLLIYLLIDFFQNRPVMVLCILSWLHVCFYFVVLDFVFQYFAKRLA